MFFLPSNDKPSLLGENHRNVKIVKKLQSMSRRASGALVQISAMYIASRTTLKPTWIFSYIGFGVMVSP